MQGATYNRMQYEFFFKNKSPNIYITIFWALMIVSVCDFLPKLFRDLEKCSMLLGRAGEIRPDPTTFWPKSKQFFNPLTKYYLIRGSK